MEKYVVIAPFDKYQKGDEITDPGVIQEIKADGSVHHCRRVVSQNS